MKYTVTKKIGKKAHHFQMEGNNLFEVVTEANKLSFPDVASCGCCGSDNLELMSRKAKDKFKYTFIKCFACGAELTFGQKQEDPDVFYLRKDKATGQYKWTQQTQEEPSQNQRPNYQNQQYNAGPGYNQGGGYPNQY